MIAFSQKTESTSQPTALDASLRPGVWRELLVRDGWAMLFVTAMTLAVELGCFFVGRVYGAEFRLALLATLGIMSLWVVLAPGPLAAWGRGNLSAFLRGGIVADATGVALLVIWMFAPAGACLTFMGVVKLYCVFVAVTLMGVSAVCLARSSAGRQVVAVIAVGLLAIALASPVWASAHIGGPSPSPEVQQTIADWAIRVNPFYAACGAVVYETNFVWHDWGMMYDFSRIGEYVSPGEVLWYQTILLYLALAGGLGLLGILRHKCRQK